MPHRRLSGGAMCPFPCGPRGDMTGPELVRALEAVLRSSETAVKTLAACYSGNSERFIYRDLRQTLFCEEWMVGEAAYEEISLIVTTISSIIEWVAMTYQPQTKSFDQPSASPRLSLTISETSKRISFVLGMLRNIIERTAPINAQFERERENLRRDQPARPLRPTRTNSAPSNTRRPSYRATDRRIILKPPTDKEIRGDDLMRFKQALVSFEVNIDAMKTMVEAAEAYLSSRNYGYWLKGPDTGRKATEICRQILLSKAGFMKEFFSMDEQPVDGVFREQWLTAVMSSPTSKNIHEIV